MRLFRGGCGRRGVGVYVGGDGPALGSRGQVALRAPVFLPAVAPWAATSPPARRQGMARRVEGPRRSSCAQCSAFNRSSTPRVSSSACTAFLNSCFAFLLARPGVIQARDISGQTVSFGLKLYEQLPQTAQCIDVAQGLQSALGLLASNARLIETLPCRGSLCIRLLALLARRCELSQKSRLPEERLDVAQLLALLDQRQTNGIAPFGRLGHFIESQPFRGHAAALLGELPEQFLQLDQRSELVVFIPAAPGGFQCAPGTFELRARRPLLFVESLAPIGRLGHLGRHGNVGEHFPIGVVGCQQSDGGLWTLAPFPLSTPAPF